MLLNDGVLTVKRIPAFKALYKPKRFKVFYGGRGSGKSWEIAQALLLQGISSKIRVLCGRELQKSIQDSVHRLLVDTIERLDLAGNYTHTKNNIIGTNGTEFVFAGFASNITAVKSMEGITHLWVEEAENVSEYSWNILIPTFRVTGSEIWVSFNPFDEMDNTYQRFITPYLKDLDSTGIYEDERHYIRKVNHDENPFFSGTELQAEMEKDKATDYNKYLHIWEGEPNADYEDSIIKPEWVRASIDSHLKLPFEPLGVKVLSFDPADEGDDAKAISYRHGSVVYDAKQHKEGDVHDGINWAFSHASDYGCSHLVYDGIGVGAAVKERLRHVGPTSQIKFEPFIASHAPAYPKSRYQEDQKNQDVFKNLRAQAWWHLRDRFYNTYQAVEKGVYTDPERLISLSSDITALQTLKSELVRVQRKRMAHNLIQIESKSEMKRRGMPSPNLADTLVMSFAVKIIPDNIRNIKARGTYNAPRRRIGNG